MLRSSTNPNGVEAEECCPGSDKIGTLKSRQRFRIMFQSPSLAQAGLPCRHRFYSICLTYLRIHVSLKAIPWPNEGSLIPFCESRKRRHWAPFKLSVLLEAPLSGNSLQSGL